MMCQTLGIARSSYYQSQHKTESKRSRENKKLTKKIIQIHQDSEGRYGAPRIHQILLEQGLQVSIKRMQRLMRKEDIRSIILKKYKPHSSKSTVEERTNLLEQDFSTTTINEKWVADITYIHTQKDVWCYLASVMDLYSKKIIGYLFSRNMTTNLVVKERYGSEYNDYDLVCPTFNGNPCNFRNLTQLWKKLIKKSEVPDIWFHDLRHTHATLMLKQGIHPKIVSKRLGHKRVGITLDTYSHVVPGLQEKAVEDFANNLFQKH
ncbi:hypothetical protein bmyco0003_19860 [Bacillus pseudomycoides]|nr:hypothetical protein bmyco0003_19860 [Bacillus pseudomycoides]